MRTRWTGALSLGVVLAAAAAGCPFPPGADGDGDGDADTTTRDIASYNELTVELEEARVEFGGEEIAEMFPAGNVIYWLEYPGQWDPTVHSLDMDTGRRVDYVMPITGDNPWVRVSSEAVAYAEEDGQDNIFHVYSSADGQEITNVVVSAPTDEQRYWAYALGGTDLYYIVTASDESPGTKLFRVSVGGQPEQLTTLESAGCAQVGEFADFGISGGTMIFIEGGRIWSLDLPTNRATWLENETEISWGSEVNFAADGVLFTTAEGPWFFDYATKEAMDVEAAIAAADYRLSETFASAHLYYEQMTRWRDYFVYIGNSGVFAFNAETGEVFPVLLTPRQGETSDLRVEYRYPVALDNGTLFLTALESESGAVGADGPIYEVDLTAILP